MSLQSDITACKSIRDCCDILQHALEVIGCPKKDLAKHAVSEDEWIKSLAQQRLKGEDPLRDYTFGWMRRVEVIQKMASMVGGDLERRKIIEENSLRNNTFDDPGILPDPSISPRSYHTTKKVKDPEK